MTAWITCPRCEGQTYDRGSCSLCGNLGVLDENGESNRVMATDAARAVGRFKANGPDGYRAATAPSAPLRAAREAAVDDEREWLDA